MRPAHRAFADILAYGRAAPLPAVGHTHSLIVTTRGHPIALSGVLAHAAATALEVMRADGGVDAAA